MIVKRYQNLMARPWYMINLFMMANLILSFFEAWHYCKISILWDLDKPTTNRKMFR